jgi:hypothetical protein
LTKFDQLKRVHGEDKSNMEAFKEENSKLIAEINVYLITVFICRKIIFLNLRIGLIQTVCWI